MKINDKDISEYGDVIQWKVEPGNPSFKNDSTWNSGAVLPIFQDNPVTFKDITVTLAVRGSGREAIKQVASDIRADCRGEVEVELDGWEHGFCGVLEKSTIKELSELSRERFQTLTLEFTGYEHGDWEETTFSGKSSVEVTNPGNIPSPLILEITPTLGASTLTVTGICRDSFSGEDLEVTISTLTTSNTIILNGKTGLITENGEQKAGEVDMWALPSLLPGTNTITFSNARLKGTAKVLPLYL